MPYLPYEEPGITTILSLASFLLILNAIRFVLDRILYCGIIGEILIGIIWGFPVGGTAWLTDGMQKTIQAFGYLGLIGLVFEGGLSTDLALLRKSAYMSISIATVGLLSPIALSFILIVFPFPSSSGTVYPSPLASFSAGASLCSTSLGTTFAILSSSGMQQTPVGVVLVGAAMMDDVVGLVMINIVTALGSGRMGGWQIARPIVASFGLLLVTLAVVPYILKPIWRVLVHKSKIRPEDAKPHLWKSAIQLIGITPHLSFVLSSATLAIFVTVAFFIDASVLFATFIAGGVVSFLWKTRDQQDESAPPSRPFKMYEAYYKPSMDFILVPFFFASIGFSIPVTDMFHSSIVWKGVIYSILMIIAKGLVGIVVYLEYSIRWIKYQLKRTKSRKSRNTESFQLHTADSQAETSQREQLSPDLLISQLPHSIALLVALAMIARGEIGFLIASLSQSSGTLTLQSRNPSHAKTSSEDIFLVLVWAVVLCTVVGPVGVGIIVRRLKRGNRVSIPGWL